MKKRAPGNSLSYRENIRNKHPDQPGSLQSAPTIFFKNLEKEPPEKGRKGPFWAKKAKFSKNEKKGPREFPKL